MAKVMRNPNSTASGRTVFGQISRTTMENVDSPRARATSTNSRVETFIPSAREMRTTRGIVMKPMVPIRTGSEEPSAAMTISASRMGGKARNRSASQVTASSNQPRSSAALYPSAMPARKPSTVEARAMPRVRCAPPRSLESTSRPMVSPPSGPTSPPAGAKGLTAMSSVGP